MSDNQNRGVNDLAKYDAMTTEELEEILRLDVDAPEGQETDTDILLYVMEVLVERKRTQNSHTENRALEAYESFKKNYMPEVENDPIAPTEKVTPRVRSLRWLRALSAVAAVLMIIVLGSVTAKAFGVDVWQSVVKWTQETFHFGSGQQVDEGPDSQDNLPYKSFEDTLRKGGIDTPLVPTWIPDGYQLVDITVDQTPLLDMYTARYLSREKELIFTVRNHLESDPQYVEQSKDFVEIYESSGIAYYLLSNNEHTQAIWIVESYECYILGDLTIDELKMMIDSIEKG